MLVEVFSSIKRGPKNILATKTHIYLESRSSSFFSRFISFSFCTGSGVTNSRDTDFRSKKSLIPLSTLLSTSSGFESCRTVAREGAWVLNRLGRDFTRWSSFGAVSGVSEPKSGNDSEPGVLGMEACEAGRDPSCGLFGSSILGLGLAGGRGEGSVNRKNTMLISSYWIYTLVPYHPVQVIATHLKIGCQEISLLVPYLQMSCSDLIKMIGYLYSSLSKSHQGDMPVISQQKMGDSSIDLLIFTCTVELYYCTDIDCTEHIQHWFSWWLGTIRQQAITWANVDPNIYCHVMSLEHNDLMQMRHNCALAMESRLFCINPLIDYPNFVLTHDVLAPSLGHQELQCW